MARRDGSIAARLMDRGVDLTKDYFSHNDDTRSLIDDVRKQMGISGRNNAGREPARQFYYAAQRGYQKLAGGVRRATGGKG